MNPQHARGAVGEQGMGFEHYPSSEGWVIIEGPSGVPASSGAGTGHGVTASGFDAIAYNTRTHEVHLVDNKSLKRAGNVTSATAIDPSRNLPQNIDAAILRLRAARDVSGRIKVLDTLTKGQAALKAGTPLPPDLNLVVTGVGGRSTGVSGPLFQQGVRFEPGASPASGSGSLFNEAAALDKSPAVQAHRKLLAEQAAAASGPSAEVTTPASSDPGASPTPLSTESATPPQPVTPPTEAIPSPPETAAPSPEAVPRSEADQTEAVLPAPTSDPAPTAASPPAESGAPTDSGASPESQTSPKLRVATPQQPDVVTPENAAATAPDQPAGPTPKLRVATPEAPAGPDRVRVADPHAEAARRQALAQAEAEHEQEQEQLVAKRLVMRLPGHGPEKKDDEPFWRLSRNLDTWRKDPKTLSTREQAVVAGGAILGGAGGRVAGELAVHGARDFSKGFAKARREPIVESVNPAYPAPPGRPQDVIDIQNQILATLDARAAAENVAKAAAGQEAHHKANEKPLSSLEQGTATAITATQAHQRAVDIRAVAAQQSKESHVTEKAGLADYTNRAAKLSALTFPMRAFKTYTGLASSLPDDPSILQGAKRGLLKMNRDSDKFLSQLDSMDKTIGKQQAGQGAREEQTQAAATKIDQTGAEAKTSDSTLGETKKSTEDFGAQNTAKAGEAGKLKADADRTGKSLDASAETKKSQAQTLAAALDSWAQQHQKARVDAIAQTRKRLEAKGYKVTGEAER